MASQMHIINKINIYSSTNLYLKKYKRTNNDLPNIHIKLNIEGVNSGAAEG